MRYLHQKGVDIRRADDEALRTRKLIYLKQHERYANPYDGLTIDRGVQDRSDVVNPGFCELVAARQE